MQLVIVGAGGFGREVYDVVEAMEASGASQWTHFAGFTDDMEPDSERLRQLGVAYLGTIEELIATRHDVMFSLGIGSGEVRMRLAPKLEAVGAVPATLIHPAATVGAYNELARGCVITAGARVTTNIKLGCHVQLHVNAVVGHDTVIEDFVTVLPGATISGNVRLGTGSTIGTGANVLPGIQVGPGAMVGAGAVVVHDVAANVTVAGVPARPLTSKERDAPRAGFKHRAG